MSDIKVAIKGTLQGDGSLLPANKANKGVMVVKTDGTNAGEPYGYLTKENLAQIVREELASILNGDSVSTLAKLVGLDSSANMKSITAANLASVLGAAGVDGRALTTDANTITDGRFFARGVDPANLHVPSNYGYLYARSVTEGGYTTIYQQFITFVKESYSRRGNGDSHDTFTWTDWSRDDNFGCSSLSDLASALKAIW